MPSVLYQSDLPGLDLVHRGKVRDVYAVDERRLLIVASDRLSAFDVVLPDPIPGKGEILTQLSNFWFARTAHLMPNHLTGDAPGSVLPAGTDVALYRNRRVEIGRAAGRGRGQRTGLVVSVLQARPGPGLRWSR